MPPYRTCHSERSEESKGLVRNHYGLVKATYADEKSAAVPGQRPEAGFKPASTKQRCDGAHFHGNDRRWGSVSRRGGSRTALACVLTTIPCRASQRIVPLYYVQMLRQAQGDASPMTRAPAARWKKRARRQSRFTRPFARGGTLRAASLAAGISTATALRWSRTDPSLSGAIGRCLGVVPGCAAGAPPRRRRCAGHGPSLRALCRIVLPEKYGPLPRARASILDMALRALVTDRARPARRPPIGGHHRPPRPQAVTPRDAGPMR